MCGVEWDLLIRISTRAGALDTRGAPTRIRLGMYSARRSRGVHGNHAQRSATMAVVAPKLIELLKESRFARSTGNATTICQCGVCTLFVILIYTHTVHCR